MWHWRYSENSKHAWRPTILRKQQVERARYESELGQRRYLRVDPDNRLVADSLEADSNNKLRALAEAQQEYECCREPDRRIFTEEQREALLALAPTFRGCGAIRIPLDRERKRVIRLLIEDATLLRDRSWARPVYVAVHNRAAEIAFQNWENVLEVAPEKISVIGSILDRLGSANLAKQRFDSQNANVSSSAIMMTGGPPDEIFTALAKVCLPPADSAHFWSASIDGKYTSATR